MEPKGRLYGIPDVMEDIKIIVAMIQAKGMRGKIIRNTKKNKKLCKKLKIRVYPVICSELLSTYKPKRTINNDCKIEGKLLSLIR